MELDFFLHLLEGESVTFHLNVDSGLIWMVVTTFAKKQKHK
jgi:hypothetical protein